MIGLVVLFIPLLGPQGVCSQCHQKPTLGNGIDFYHSLSLQMEQAASSTEDMASFHSLLVFNESLVVVNSLLRLPERLCFGLFRTAQRHFASFSPRRCQWRPLRSGHR
jgi:hypothetical protein